MQPPAPPSLDAGADRGAAGDRLTTPPRGALSVLLQELAATPGAPPSWERPLAPGEVVGRFELLRELGRGGFGVVYEARDRELGRSVAFKAVRPGRAAAASEQIAREAEAAARLSHPNLVTLYDAGRCEQGPYLVLELLRGATLRERLAHGPMALPEALRVAVEIARGLAHAHGQGVVHRDLKPSNVFLCEGGLVKVLDFGMAHAFGRERRSGGTVPYMAPEQLRGAPEDERTDVFALGVILYEALAGELPFPEGRGAETSRRAPGLRVPDAPALGRLVDRMLEKDPVLRPRSAGEVLSALVAFQQELERLPSSTQTVRIVRRGRRGMAIAALVAGGVALGAAAAVLALRPRPAPAPAPGSGTPCVAVLPLSSLSSSPEDAFFADGLHGELITQLAKMSGLRVIARGSVQGYREAARDLKGIAGALGASVLLEGSVQRAGGRVRVAAQLVDPHTGQELWADRFDRIASDIFSIQTEVALEIARALGARLTAAERRLVERAPTRDLEAHELYLRALHFWERSMDVESDNRAAEELLEKALARDPGFALAHALLSDVKSGVGDCAGSQRHADRARALQPDLPQAHAAQGSQLWRCRRDADGALREYELAAQGAPGDADTRVMVGSLRALVGRFDEALADLGTALALDPRSYLVAIEVAKELAPLRRFDEAAGACLRARQASPDDAHALATCALIPFWRDGNLGPARAAVDALPRELPRAGAGAGSVLLLLGLVPDRTLALLQAGRLPDPFSSAAPFLPRDFVAGVAHAQLGHAGEARAAFQAALGPLEARSAAEPGSALQRLVLARAYAGAGRADDGLREARRVLAEAREEQRKGLALRALAEVAAAAGRADEALDALAATLARRDGLFTQASIAADPRFAALRGLPRFEALVARRRQE